MATVSVRYIVDDVDAAIAFYCQHLGFTEVMHPAPTFAMLSRGDLRLTLSAPGGPGGGGQAMPDGTMPAPGGWNNQKNVGQFVWDIVNPNENRWREGVRLMHHLLSVNKSDAKATNRTMRSLGDMYFRFFQDYARAAFWWKQAGVKPGGGPEAIYLAEVDPRSLADVVVDNSDFARPHLTWRGR